MSIHLDPLEPRRLLSVTWVNRGKDNFDRFYGANAPLARQLVDAAIADWNAALPNAKVKVRVSAANLQPGSKHPTLLGHTGGTRISLDADAAKRKWYFDPDLDDDTDLANRYADDHDGIGALDTHADFYTAALQELGHALGFSDRKNPGVVGFRKNRPVKSHAFSGNPASLMAPANNARFRAYITPYDAGHTRFAKTGVHNPTRGAFFTTWAVDGRIRLIPPEHPADPSDVIAVYRTRPDQPDADPVLVTTFGPNDRAPYFDPDTVAGVTYRYHAVVTRTVSGHRLTFTSPDSQTLAVIPGGQVVTSRIRQVTDTVPSALQFMSTLTWTPYPGADHYEIYRTTYTIDPNDYYDIINASNRSLADDLAKGWARLAGTVPGSETTFVDPGPPGDLTIHGQRGIFRYWVVAYLPGGPDGSLDPYNYPVPGHGFAGLSLPTFSGNPSDADAAGKPTLQWTLPMNPDYLDHLVVWRAPATDTTDRLAAGATPIATLPDTATSFTDLTAAPGTPYRYWLVVWAPIYDGFAPNPHPVLPFATLNSALSYTRL